MSDDITEQNSADTSDNKKDNVEESVNIVQMDPCPLQQKIETILKSSATESDKEKQEHIGMFQWILRLAGLSFTLLIVLLVVVLFMINSQHRNGQNVISAEYIFTENNLVSYVNTKFKAPSSYLKKNETQGES